MKKIKELSFGFSDAENYKRREEKDVLNKFFMHNDFLNQLCEPRVSFLIGDKGTGKTAYSVFLSNNNYKNNIAFSKFIRETDYKKFMTLKQLGQLGLSDYTTIWKVILLLLLSQSIYNHEKDYLKTIKSFFGKFDPLQKAIEEYYDNAFNSEILQAIEFVKEADVTAGLISEHIQIGVSDKKQHKFIKERFQHNLYYIQNQFQEALGCMRLRSNHILFIDGIDIRPSDVPFEDYIECIKGLADAVWQLNNDFFPSIKDSRGRARIVLLIRPDIFALLGLQNLNTKIKDNSVLLNWTTDYRDYSKSDLFKMIDKMINTQQDTQLSIGLSWKHYFPFSIRQSDDPFIFFLRYSYHRPRDIITMLDLLSKKSSDNQEYFSESDLDGIKSDYSTYALGEIKDQFMFRYSEEEYEIFLKFFEFLNGVSKFKYDEYLNTYSKYESYIKSISQKQPKFVSTANEFLQFLFDLNIICYLDYTKDNNRPLIHWCFREKTYSNLSPKVKENSEYQIFYSLAKALKVGKEYV